MPKIRYAALVAALALPALVAGGAGQAQAQGDVAAATAAPGTMTVVITPVHEPQYVAGSAVPFKPVWDDATQSYSWKCVFSGWAQVQVNWDCHLDNIFGTAVSRHTGSYGGGTYSTPVYYYRKAYGTYLCTVAYAAYNNGSASDSDEACN